MNRPKITDEPAQPCVLTEEEVERISDAVVEKVKNVMLVELGRLVWDGIRKLLITGAVALFAIDQLKGWLK